LTSRLQKLLKTFSVEKIKGMLQDIVNNSFEAAKKQKAVQITLERGIVTIMSPGSMPYIHTCYCKQNRLAFTLNACAESRQITEDLTRKDLEPWRLGSKNNQIHQVKSPVTFLWVTQ